MKEYRVQSVDGGDQLQLLLQTLTTDGWEIETILPLGNLACVVCTKKRDPLSFESLRELSNRCSSFEDFWMQLQSRTRAGFYEFVLDARANEFRIKRNAKLVVGPATIRHPLTNEGLKSLRPLGDYEK